VEAIRPIAADFPRTFLGSWNLWTKSSSHTSTTSQTHFLLT